MIDDGSSIFDKENRGCLIWCLVEVAIIIGLGVLALLGVI